MGEILEKQLLRVQNGSGLGDEGGERGQRGEVEVSITPYLYCDTIHA